MNRLVQSEAIAREDPVAPRISEAVNQIVDRAKIDRKGAFWALGANYRQGAAARFESSLGYGTPGILLALLEYYRQTKDRDISELLQQGVAWIQNRVKTGSLLQGYYTGVGGQWYLWGELEKILPGMVGAWESAARSALSTQMTNEDVASLAFGTSGTLVGALSSFSLPREKTDTELTRLLERVVAAARLSPLGTFWDFSTTSLLPPVSFLGGNAGVDYCLAHVRAQMNVSYTSLLAGSLARAEELFDREGCNWPDQDDLSHLREMKQTEIEELLDRGATGGVKVLAKAKNSLGWGTGLVGILLARATVAMTYRKGQVFEKSLADCRRANGRLERISERELSGLDSSLQVGLSGFVLGLRAYARRLEGLGVELPSALLPMAESILDRRKTAVVDDDLSLLTGTAGLVYAALKTRSRDESTVLDPLGALSSPANSATVSEGTLDSLLKQRLPNCREIKGVKNALENAPVSLLTVRASVADEQAREPMSARSKAIEHELELHLELSQTTFRTHFWRELSRQRRHGLSYGEGRDEQLLFERFRIDDSTTLLELDFDLSQPAKDGEGRKFFFVRQVTSRGIIETKLSALQYALLAGFREGAIALELIRKVMQRVEAANVTQRQLADLSLKSIRTFVTAGYIMPEPLGKFKTWIVRRKLKTSKNNFFPTGST